MHGEGETTPSSRGAITIPVEGLEPIEVEAALDGETVLIDLRLEADRVTEGIPGAIETTSQKLMSWAAGTWIDSPFELGRSRRIIVYSSDDSESRTVVESLQAMGFERVAYLVGGLDRWARRRDGATTSTDATDLEEAGK
jgi:rhodanese-related sulfurtransferase